MSTAPPPAIFIVFGAAMLIGGLAVEALGINRIDLVCERATQQCSVTRRIPGRTDTAPLTRMREAKAVPRPKAGEVDAVLLDDKGAAVLRMPVARAQVDRVVGELGEWIAGGRDEVRHVEPPNPVMIGLGGVMVVVGVGAIVVGVRRLR